MGAGPLGVGSIGVNTTKSKGTTRSGESTIFPKQFVLDYNQAFGGPMTMSDMFRLMPTPHSLFGYSPTQGAQPSGAFTLGFGPPSAGAFGGGGTGGETGGETGGGGLGNTPAPAGGAPAPAGGQQPAGAQGQTYSLADIQQSFVNDPEKVMDLPRLFRQAGLDPNGFSYEDFQQAVAKAKDYGFSGRSQGNFANALASLQRSGDLDTTFGGGKGTGIF